MVAERRLLAGALNDLHSGAAVWFVNPFSCAVNRTATKMTGFSEDDFKKDRSLWLNRVHPMDVESLTVARQKLRQEMREMVCNYRFLPNRRNQEIWLRDVSVPLENSKGGFRGMFSVYSEIPNPVAPISDNGSGADLKKVIERLAHSIRNSLHDLGANIELSGLQGPLSSQLQDAANKTREINRLVGELEEYFCPPEPHMGRGNAALLLKDVLLGMQEKLLARGIELSVEHPNPLPQVEIDPRQMRKVIDRLLAFLAAILPGTGRLHIKARPSNVHGMPYVELQITSFSPDSLPVDEKNVFEPFLQVGRYKAGLSLVLAREAMYRNFGRVSFRLKDQHQAQFKLLLKVVSR